MMVRAHPLLNSSIGQEERSAEQSIGDWRRRLLAEGGLPVIGIAGSRGKTTVAKLFESMLPDSTRIAVRSHDGVVIENELQQGEIEPWQRVEQSLRSGALDLAIWEIDWSMARAVPSTAMFGILAVTNVCSNRDSCLQEIDVPGAQSTLRLLSKCVAGPGRLVLNGEDVLTASFGEFPASRAVLVGLTNDSPSMSAHWQAGGERCWTEDGQVLIGDPRRVQSLLSTNELTYALGGEAGFMVHSGMLAAAIAHAIGIGRAEIASALRQFRNDIHSHPGSFNVAEISGIHVVVDRPTPSWFLQPIVRAIRNIRTNRVLTVVGRMRDVPDNDLEEVGRLIGRMSSIALVVTGRFSDRYSWEKLRSGAAHNEFPPLMMSFATESAAFRKALSLAAPSDIIFVLSENPGMLGHFWPAGNPLLPQSTNGTQALSGEV